MESIKDSDLRLIGKRIQDARLCAGLSQTEFAAQIGTSTSHVSRIETGRSDIKTSTFIKIIEALKVSADDLLQADVPVVNDKKQWQLQELLSDCTPSQMKTIEHLIRDVKAAMTKTEDNF